MGFTAPPTPPGDFKDVIVAAIEAARPPWYERPPWSFGIGGALAIGVGGVLKYLGWN